jgi:hypothetical protein
MSATKHTKPPLQLFYSYSHRDEEFRDELELHLWGLRRQGIISGWHDRKISAGSEWSKAISRNLESAHVILLLVSPHFIASEYCYDIEMKRAMERHDAGQARVIPVIIRAVDNWQAAPFGKLQAVPQDGRPVSHSDRNRDEAWAEVAASIRLACQEMQEVLEIQSLQPSLEEKSFKPARDTITFSGKAIELLDPSAETLAPLDRIKSVDMDVPYGQVAGVHGSRMPPDRAGTQRNIDEVLEVMNRARDESGEAVDELHAGGLNISRIDLLVKKAILLQAEAEEAQLDATVPEEERNETYRARLKESYDLLRDANKLDPTNTEVLLHMSQLLMVLTPGDTSDEKRILTRIRRLLSEPRNETEKFRLARAIYMLAVTSRPSDTALLREARTIFERLGQTRWIEQCDVLLKASGPLKAEEEKKPTVDDMGFKDLWNTVKNWHTKLYQKPPAQEAQELVHTSRPPAEAQPTQTEPRQHQPTILKATAAPSPTPQPTTANLAQPPTAQQQPSGPLQFLPLGHWQMHVNDVARSIVYVNFIQNGVCLGSQFSEKLGHIQFNARWAYTPQNRLLQLQGLINGVQPFMINICLHTYRNNGFYGVGSDGHAYFLTPHKAQ